MAQQYAYHYALIDETGYCYEVRDTTDNCDDEPNFIAIPSYDNSYLEKYYNRADGKWYTDAAFTNEWTPA